MLVYTNILCIWKQENSINEVVLHAGKKYAGQKFHHEVGGNQGHTCSMAMLRKIWPRRKFSNNSLKLIEYITTLREGLRNPIQVVNICYLRRSLPCRWCCKTWTQGWDSCVLPAMWWSIIFLLASSIIVQNKVNHAASTVDFDHLLIIFLWCHVTAKLDVSKVGCTNVLRLGETAWYHHRKMFKISVSRVIINVLLLLWKHRDRDDVLPYKFYS